MSPPVRVNESFERSRRIGWPRASWPTVPWSRRGSPDAPAGCAGRCPRPRWQLSVAPGPRGSHRSGRYAQRTPGPVPIRHAAHPSRAPARHSGNAALASSRIGHNRRDMTKVHGKPPGRPDPRSVSPNTLKSLVNALPRQDRRGPCDAAHSAGGADTRVPAAAPASRRRAIAGSECMQHV